MDPVQNAHIRGNLFGKRGGIKFSVEFLSYLGQAEIVSCGRTGQLSVMELYGIDVWKILSSPQGTVVH